MPVVVESLVASLGLDIDRRAFRAGLLAIQDIKMGLLGMSAKIAGIFIGSMEAMAVSTARAANSLRIASIRTGVSAEALAELHFAAERTGTKVGELDRALAMLSATATKASFGETGANKALFMLGVQNIRQANGELKTSEQLLMEIADLIEKAPQAKRGALINAMVASRGGMELLPLLQGGAAALQKLRDEARRTGIPQELAGAIEKSKEFHVQLGLLKNAFKGLEYGVGGAILEDLTKALERIRKWLTINRVAIRDTLVRPMLLFGKALAWCVDNINLFIVGLTVLTSIRIISGLWALVAALRAISAAEAFILILSGLMTGVALAWAVAIGVLVLLVEDFIGYLQGKDSVLGHILRAFSDKGDEAWNRFKLFHVDDTWFQTLVFGFKTIEVAVNAVVESLKAAAYLYEKVQAINAFFQRVNAFAGATPERDKKLHDRMMEEALQARNRPNIFQRFNDFFVDPNNEKKVSDKIREEAIQRDAKAKAERLEAEKAAQQYNQQLAEKHIRNRQLLKNIWNNLTGPEDSSQEPQSIAKISSGPVTISPNMTVTFNMVPPDSTDPKIFAKDLEKTLSDWWTNELSSEGLYPVTYERSK